MAAPSLLRADVVLLCALLLSARAAEIHVSPSGIAVIDVGTGGVFEAFLIGSQDAALETARAGDTIWIHQGTYSFDTQKQNWPNAAYYINQKDGLSIKAWPGDKPVFDGGVTDNFGGTYYQKGDHAVFHVRQQNGVTIEGLEIRNTLGHAFYIDGCNNCIFTKNTMYELGYSCITGETTVPSPGTEFTDNDCHDACKVNYGAWLATNHDTWGFGIQTYGVESNWYMRRNKMGRIWGDAIQAGFVDSVIDSNEIYNAWAGLLYLDSYKVIRNLQITNNYLWHDGQPPFLRSGYSPEQCVGSGIESGTGVLTQLLIANNVMYGCRGVEFAASTVGGAINTYSNIWVVQNTFYKLNPQGGSLIIEDMNGAVPSGCYMANNIFDTPFRISPQGLDPSIWTITNNVWASTSNPATTGLNAGVTTPDQVFQNLSPASFPAGLTPLPRSVVVGAGIQLPNAAWAPNDYFRVRRPSPPSLGAIEVTVPTVPPTVPPTTRPPPTTPAPTTPAPTTPSPTTPSPTTPAPTTPAPTTPAPTTPAPTTPVPTTPRPTTPAPTAVAPTTVPVTPAPTTPLLTTPGPATSATPSTPAPTNAAPATTPPPTTTTQAPTPPPTPPQFATTAPPPSPAASSTTPPALSSGAASSPSPSSAAPFFTSPLYTRPQGSAPSQTQASARKSSKLPTALIVAIVIVVAVIVALILAVLILIIKLKAKPRAPLYSNYSRMEL